MKNIHNPFWGANMQACFEYLDQMGHVGYGTMSPDGFAYWVDELTGKKSDHTQHPEDWAIEVLPALREMSINIPAPR